MKDLLRRRTPSENSGGVRRNSLGTFIVRRVAIGILLMLGITFISFSVTQLVPGDPAALNLGQSAMSDPTIVKALSLIHI